MRRLWKINIDFVQWLHYVFQKDAVKITTKQKLLNAQYIIKVWITITIAEDNKYKQKDCI